MGRYISIGNFNKHYFYILLSIISKFIGTFITGFYPTLSSEPIYLFGIKIQILSHPIFRCVIQYFGIMIGGILLRKYIKNKKNYDYNRIDKNEKKHLSDKCNILIYNDLKIIKTDFFFLKIFIIFLCFYSYSGVICFFDSYGFHQVKIWTFEYFSAIFFSQRILNKQISIHKKLSFILAIIIQQHFL